jgi:hypothetical protein
MDKVVGSKIPVREGDEVKDSSKVKLRERITL